MKKPNLITQSDLWDYLDQLHKKFSEVLEAKNLEGTLLLSEITEDLRCNYDWLIKQIKVKNLKAYFLKDTDRKRGGWRVERKDYEEFKKQLQFDSEREEYIYIQPIESIVKEFQLERGLGKSRKGRKISCLN
ncbi:MAG: hypothetical protein RDU14_17380 [Melioribacteraceae bacterium]|nr:hypothetical protein [Melioribacteraceae bacterium]